MHLCEIEAIAVGQDGSRPGLMAEGQLYGTIAYSHYRPQAVRRDRPVWRGEISSPWGNVLLIGRFRRSCCALRCL
jgi:hypothetical protein